MSNLQVRYSVQQLQQMYDNGNQAPLEDLMRAWKGIKELPPEDLNSFFVIGGYHGEPFAGQGATDPSYWGGYCNHGNVLFPTWHRVYVYHIERALQSVVPGVTMPYWDETSEETLENGIPNALTAESFYLDGEWIVNPLRSFVLPKQVNDDVSGDDQRYTKPAGYETVRYPLSGLVGTAEDRARTASHNADFPNYQNNVSLLNANVMAWLVGSDVTPANPHPYGKGVYWQFQQCLQAPNYTAFSNTTSAAAWNNDNSGYVVPLEQPHNDVHLAVGGFDMGSSDLGQVAGSNGDMGENNTAGLDPIFFFHHCNVDRMFWLWQVQNGYVDNFEIIPGYAGTSANTLPNGQGPAVGQTQGEELTMDTPLYPFLKDSSDPSSVYTSRDCINLESQMGVTYSDGSMQQAADITLARMANVKKLKVSGIDRSLFNGSFVVTAYADIGDKRVHLGRHTVLSRWNVKHCANCQTHLLVDAFFTLEGLSAQEIEQAMFSIEINHRGENLPASLAYSCDVVD